MNYIPWRYFFYSTKGRGKKIQRMTIYKCGGEQKITCPLRYISISSNKLVLEIVHFIFQ